MRDLRALPKAHLHLHLEGGQRPAMLRDLLSRYSLPTPEPGDGTFDTFSRIANIVFRALHSPDEYLRLLRELAEDARHQGAVWLEPAVWITPATATRIGLADMEAVLQLLIRAAADAQAATGVGMGFMVAAAATIRRRTRSSWRDSPRPTRGEAWSASAWRVTRRAGRRRRSARHSGLLDPPA